MKKLVTSKTIADFANARQGKYFLVEEGTIISPAARDTANNYEIKIVYELPESEKAPCKEELCESVKGCQGISEADKALIVEMVMKVLAEKGLLDKICN